MQLTWYGHSCFLMEFAASARILTDPFDPSVGYPALHDLAADAVTLSHHHHDHNYVEAVSGNPTVIDTVGEHTVGDVRITGFPSWHDEAEGKKRGANILYLFECEGLRVLHLGDLGHPLTSGDAATIGRVDVLLCPVGGNYTIDAEQAKRVAALLDPAIFIPMHYATAACGYPIDGLDAFLRLAGERNVHRINGTSCSLTADALGEKRVIVLDYVK